MPAQELVFTISPQVFAGTGGRKGAGHDDLERGLPKRELLPEDCHSTRGPIQASFAV
jgi:hypothetical protein